MARSIVERAPTSASHTHPTPNGRPPAGVKLDPHPRFNAYRGSAQDLIAAGVVRPDQLPGSPGLPATCVTFYKGQRVGKGDSRGARDEHYLQIRREGKGFCVHVGVSPEERERRFAEMAAERERERQEEQEQRKARQALIEAEFRSNPENLRWQAEASARILARLIADHTPGDHDKRPAHFSCRFSPEGLDDVLDALQEVAEWLREAEITALDPNAPKVSAARADASFQAFLQSQCLKG